MRLQLDPEEARELLAVIVDRLLDEAGLAAADRAAISRWRSDAMRPGSEGMRELTAKLNTDIDRALQTKSRSAVVRPDWR